MKQFILRTNLLFFLALFTSSLLSEAQQTSSPLKQNVNRKRQVECPEKVYVHLDRPSYLVGETLWLKMWVTDEDRKASQLSSVGYLEVINADQIPVIQAKVSLQNGSGDGSLPIPANIPTGNYVVRAYTRWMKNFPSSHYFETSISILNPFVSVPSEQTATSNEELPPDIQFFAEGGLALVDVECKVAVKAQTPEGIGMEFEGRLSDQNGTLVASFRSLTSGMGQFRFTPSKGASYQVEILDAKGKTYTFPLDLVRETGYALQLRESEDEIALTVNSGASQSNNFLHLLIYNGKESVAYQTPTPSGKANFVVPKSALKPGVNALIVFDQNLSPVAERLFFQPFRQTPTVEMNPEKRVFGKREKVTLDIQPLDLSDSLESSLAVYITDSLPAPDSPSINAYLLLVSDLKGHIENPDQYFNRSTSDQREAIDLLMLTHGWRRYQKEQLLSDQIAPKFLPELDGHLITGKIVSLDHTTARPNRPIFAAYPSMKANPWVAISDNDGKFLLETRDFVGTKELVFQTNFRADSTCAILVNDPFAPASVSTIRLPGLSSSDISREDLLKRSINMQTLNSYFPPRKILTKPDSIAFFGKPDFSYFLDDYTRFPTMEEVLSEYIPTVMVRLRRGKYYTRVVETGVHKQLFTEDPLLLIDGIPVFDTDRIVNFDPLKIKKAEVVNRMYYLGPLTFPGIVSYSTYTNDLSGFEVDPRALVIAYHGTLEKREFYAPVYDQPRKNAQRLADLRNLMFWSPSVTVAPGVKKQVEFYTSDQPGTYNVVLQGLSKNGTPVSARTKLTVTD
jgi:hypothetical protein